MGTTNDPTSLAGDFKNLYEKMGLVNAIPEHLILQKRIPFEEADAGLGQFYVFGVILQKEQGFTYAPSSGVNSGVQTLNASVSGYVGQAQIEGFSIYLRSRLSYDAAAKASRAGKKAFAQAYGAVLKNMKESHQFRLECSLMFGRDGLGVVSSNTAGVIVITDATWAAGIWATGMSGALLEAWTGTGATATQHNGDLTISTASVVNKSVTVTGTNSSVVANDVLYFKSARTATAYNECAGVFRILNNSGVLFNIDASLYSLWGSQSYAVNGNASLTAYFNAAARGVTFGLKKAFALISPTKFSQLASDEAALRRYVQDVKETDRGVKGISFMMGSVEIEILPHPVMWEGYSMVVPDGELHRVGATDVTFNLPGTSDPMQVHIADSTAVEFRSMSDQGIYMDTPAKAILMTGIS